MGLGTKGLKRKFLIKNVYCQHMQKNSHFILQVPYTIAVSEFFTRHPDLWQQSALESTHIEQQVWIIFTVNRHKTVFPS